MEPLWVGRTMILFRNARDEGMTAPRPEMTERYQDPGEVVDAFTGQTLVECPRCGGCALSATEDRLRGWRAPRRLACTGCGLSKRWVNGERRVFWCEAEPRDSYFGLRLWLQAPCSGQTLWAFNYRHLAFIESVVAAKLRERTSLPTFVRNKSLMSRLPRWLKLAKHREQVLRSIRALRERTLEDRGRGSR
jgi:hypothetical protein